MWHFHDNNTKISILEMVRLGRKTTQVRLYRSLYLCDLPSCDLIGRIILIMNKDSKFFGFALIYISIESYRLPVPCDRAILVISHSLLLVVNPDNIHDRITQKCSQ